jgi:hypothetical protein
MGAVVSIRAALETAINAISPSISTGYENSDFTPPEITVSASVTELQAAYQMVHILFAEPSNATYGSAHQALGYVQIRLMYPPQRGTAAINARAELIRSTFYRGASFTDSGYTVVISRTPEIMPGQNEDGRFAQIVKIPFQCTVNS